MSRDAKCGRSGRYILAIFSELVQICVNMHGFTSGISTRGIITIAFSTNAINTSAISTNYR